MHDAECRIRNGILDSAFFMTRQERQEFLKILQAHARTVAICEACATTTRDLAAEVARGSMPRAADLKTTIAEAERTLAELARVREEVERLMTAFGRLW
jgi:sulfur relay (sulfurtransferase) complex TusBCD TusD component (DsrE family)